MVEGDDRSDNAAAKRSGRKGNSYPLPVRKFRRILFLIPIILFFAFAEIINWLCLLLDEIFYRSYKKIKIISPVFIIGMPRTGSTYLHNLLYNDMERFSSMKLWEMLFCPSVIQKKVARLLFSSTSFMNSCIMRGIRKLDRFMFRKYQTVHHSGLFYIEEDDYLLLHILASHTLLFMFPEIKRFRALTRFDELVSEKRKRRIISFYRKGIQKHMMVYGNGRKYLSKCPPNTSKIDSLLAKFDGIRFICLFREPEDTIPSTINFLLRLSQIYYSPLDLQTIREQVLETADHLYAYPLEKLTTRSRHEFIVAGYKQVTRKPEWLIENIYKRFGYSMNEEYREKIRSEQQTANKYRSSQQHPPEKFGLTSGELESRFKKPIEELTKLSEYAN